MAVIAPTVALAVGFILGRVFNGLRSAGFVLARGEKSRITFTRRGQIPFVEFYFESSVFSLIPGRRHLYWRRFKEDEKCKDLAAAAKAWKYRAWVDGENGPSEMEVGFSERRGMILHLPNWQSLPLRALKLKEQFVVPMLATEAGGAIAALKRGKNPVSQVVFREFEARADKELTFSWRRRPPVAGEERASMGAVADALKYQRWEGGWGEDLKDDILAHRPSPGQSAEEHPIIKAARLRLKQPRRQ